MEVAARCAVPSYQRLTMQGLESMGTVSCGASPERIPCQQGALRLSLVAAYCAELGSLLESYVEQSFNHLLTFNQEPKI